MFGELIIVQAPVIFVQPIVREHIFVQSHEETVVKDKPRETGLRLVK